MRLKYYILQILIVKAMFFAQVIVFVIEHSTTNRTVSDAIANKRI